MKKIENYSVISSSETLIQPISILLVDDQNFARRFVTKSLEFQQDFKIIGTADNGKEAIALVESLKPEVALIDLEMPEMDGITTTEIIVQKFPETKVLILSSYDTEEYLQKALRAGAKGYLIKGSPAKELCNAIHSVYRGYTQLSPGLIERVLTREVEVITPTERDLEPESEAQSELEWAASTREAIDTLPRISLRAIFYILLLLMAGIIPWAAFAKVDEVGSARGKLEPQGRVVDIGASVDGKVVSVAVEEGDRLEANQPIMELDSEVVDTELQQNVAKLQSQQDRVNQLELLKNQQVLALRTQQQQNAAQQSEKKAAIEQARQEIETSQSERDMAIIRASAAKEKVPRYQEAYTKGALSRDLLSEAQQQAKENKERVKQTASEIAKARSLLKEQQRSLESLIQSNNLSVLKSREEYKDTESQITVLKGEIAQTQSIIAGLEYQVQQRVIYAPITGTVFKLPVKKPGAVVQMGQTIAQIAPKGSPLVLRGKMSSSESGLLEVGLPVKIKFDAFPFQDYGVVPGRLTWISPNSSSDSNDPQAQQQSPGQEFFDVEIELERNYIENYEKKVTLTPGQTATAEVVIRKRRLIDVFLSPFKSLQKGGIEI